MPTRLSTGEPDSLEEARRLAEAVADLHYTIGLIVEQPDEIIAGEAIEELKEMWATSGGEALASIVRGLTERNPENDADTAISHADLTMAGLTGAAGKAKRSLLHRLKDRFLMFWRSSPRTHEKRTSAAIAACDYLDFGSSVVGSIPGGSQAVEVISLVKQLIGIRLRRGV